MIKFIGTPMFDNCLRDLRLADLEESLVMCSPYIKKEAVRKFLSRGQPRENVSVQILIRGKLEDFLKGSSDIEALRLLVDCFGRENVFRVTNLHMKAYMYDRKKLLITSGNWTVPGMLMDKRRSNVEAGIFTDDADVISDFLAYYGEVMQSAESAEAFYDELMEKYFESIAKADGGTLEMRQAGDEASFRHEFRMYAEAPYEESGDSLTISAGDVPKINNFYVGAYLVPALIRETGSGVLNKTQVGIRLTSYDKNETANAKYGEIAVDLATFLGFTWYDRKVYLTPLGEFFLDAAPEEQLNIIKNQLINSAIVRAVCGAAVGKDRLDVGEFLRENITGSASEASRKAVTVRKIFSILCKMEVPGAEEICGKIYKREYPDRDRTLNQVMGINEEEQ